MTSAIISMDALHDLEQGKEYIVKIRDIDGVQPDSRGKEFQVTFRSIEPNNDMLSEPIPHGGFSNNPAEWKVIGDATDGSGYVYGFHGWLIEEITPA
jgi:hypothetical protein